MHWNIFQVCVTKIREGIWEMRLELFAEKGHCCSRSRWHITTWVRWAPDSVAVTGRALLGLASGDRILRPHRKAPVKTGKSWKWQKSNFQLFLHPAGSTPSSFANHIGKSFGKDFTYAFLHLVSLIFIYCFLGRQRKSSNNSYHSSQAHKVKAYGPPFSLHPKLLSQAASIPEPSWECMFNC